MKLEALGWVPKPNLAGIANALKSFDKGITVIPPILFNFLSNFINDETTSTNNNMKQDMTLKGKQAVKARPVCKSVVKAKETVMEDEDADRQDVGPPFDAEKHTMNVPKVCMNIHNLKIM